MSLPTITQTKAKPFLKWAGGKTQLLPAIDYYLPANLPYERRVTYMEPFVGGGAMLFYMLQTYPNIRRAIINDINPHLIKAYKVIRERPTELIDYLREIQMTYRALDRYEARKDYYLKVRSRFNTATMDDVEEASLLIFMNRTCFNGLYRENSKGEFNVPFGRYVNPLICDEQLILANSRLLEKVEILNGDYSGIAEHISDEYTFIYFDPPYRPLDATSSFNSYVKETFDDDEQMRLRDFFAELSLRGCRVMLSNSDGRGRNANDIFFDELYKEFNIERVLAKRCINANPSKRGVLTELLIRNYDTCKGESINIFKAV